MREMSKDQMVKELERIFDVALNMRHQAQSLAKSGMKTPLSAYRCGERDALEFVLDELSQTFGLTVAEGR